MKAEFDIDHDHNKFDLKLELNSLKSVSVQPEMDDTTMERLHFDGSVHFLCVDTRLDFDVCNYLSDPEACG